MKARSTHAQLSVLAVAVALVFHSSASFADIDITSDTSYSAQYDEPVHIKGNGELTGTTETEMNLNKGLALSEGGTLTTAKSLNVNGDLTVSGNSNINNVTTATISGKLTMQNAGQTGPNISVGTLNLNGYSQLNAGSLTANGIKAQEVYASSDIHIDADDASFTTFRINDTNSDASVTFGKLNISTALRVQSDVTVTANSIQGDGFIATEGNGSEISVNGDVDIKGHVAGRNNSSITVTGNIHTDDQMQLELGAQLSAASLDANKIHITGDNSSATIEGAVSTNEFRVDAGSFSAHSLSGQNDGSLDDFSNKGTLTLEEETIVTKKFLNSGSINADENGISHLDNLTVMGDTWLGSSLDVKDFNAQGKVTVQNDAKVSVDKLGTADIAVSSISVETADSELSVAGDAYFSSGIGGSGTVIIGKTANMVAEYLEIRSKFMSENMVVNGMTALYNDTSVTNELEVQNNGTLIVETGNLASGENDALNHLIINDSGKVQMRSGSSGTVIDQVTMNTNENAYLQSYGALTVNNMSITGDAVVSTWANGEDSSLALGDVSVTKDSTIVLQNRGTFDGVNSTASIKNLNLENGANFKNVGGTRQVDGEDKATPAFDGLSIQSVEGVNAEIQSEGSMTIGTLAGSGNTIRINTVEKGVVIESNQSDNLIYETSGIDADTLGTSGAFEKVAEMVKDSENTFTTKVGDGLVNGGGTATFDESGNMVFSSTGESMTMSALKQFNAATLANWRYETNHLSQRLGEVRDHLEAAGAWARVYGADSKVTDTVTTEVKMNTIQVGADTTVGNNWIVGGAFSYTNMDGDISNGSADGNTYSLAAYASGFFDCGGYVDVVGRIGRLSTDIETYTSSGRLFDGSYDNTALALSVETGYHWSVTPTFYVEPQAELAYGYVFGDDFSTSSKVKVEQDDFQTLVGRLGARVGASFPKETGSVYLHASLNHEFLGDNDFSAAYDGYDKTYFSNELDGTWVSYGLGFQINASDALYLYGNLERANGDDYQDDYRYSIGARYVF